MAISTFWGDATGSELTVSLEELHAHLALSPGEVGTLWDMRNAALGVMHSDIERIALALRRWGELSSGRGAFVMEPKQTTVSALGRLVMEKGASERRPRRLFTDYDEALAWVLGA